MCYLMLIFDIDGSIVMAAAGLQPTVYKPMSFRYMKALGVVATGRQPIIYKFLADVLQFNSAFLMISI